MLNGDGLAIDGKGPGLRCEVVIALAHFGPCFQLLFKECIDVFLRGSPLPIMIETLTGGYLDGSQLVLVVIVLVDALGSEGCIGVSFPSATKINDLEDAANLILSRKGQSKGIVLTITGVGYANLSQQRREECTWSAQAIDAQGIVASVFICPLLVIYDAWRKSAEVKITHAVSTDYHGATFFIELIDNHLKSGFTRIEIVGIELDGKTTATRILNGQIPTAADAEVVTLRDDK